MTSMFWIYDLPNSLFCALVVATVCLFGVGGLFLTRPLMARWFRESEGVNEMVGYTLSTIGMFYGITLGLIAVGAWQTFGDVQGIVSQESAALAALYRYVSQYPEPARSELQSGMQEYTLFVIQKGWPAQRKGLTPREGTKSLVKHVINPLGAFEPHNLREQVLHQEAMRQLSNMIELRRKRFESVSSGMPISLWTLVLAGAALNLSLCWLFRCRKFSLHAALMGVLSVLLGLLIFMIAAMDYPFRGEMSVGPDAFQLVYDEVMMAK